MTRSKSITYDNLRLRAPEFVREVDAPFRARGARSRPDVDVERPLPPMFQPFRLREHGARQPRRRLAHVHVFGGGRHAARIAISCISARAPGRRRPHLHRDDLRLARSAHHAMAAPGSRPTRRKRPGSASSISSMAIPSAQDLPAARSCRPQGRDQADVGGHGRAAGRRAPGRSSPPRRCPIIRTARCRAR